MPQVVGDKTNQYKGHGVVAMGVCAGWRFEKITSITWELGKSRSVGGVIIFLRAASRAQIGYK